MLMNSFARSYVTSIVMELRGICGNPLYDKWGIVVIYSRNITLCTLGCDANHFMRNFLQWKGTPLYFKFTQCQGKFPFY